MAVLAVACPRPAVHIPGITLVAEVTWYVAGVALWLFYLTKGEKSFFQLFPSWKNTFVFFVLYAGVTVLLYS